jgi:hypothetical protein
VISFSSLKSRLSLFIFVPDQPDQTNQTSLQKESLMARQAPNSSRQEPSQSEQDYRLAILDSFLQSPHRKVEAHVPVHTDVLTKDPLFYGHLAVWAQDNISIRDHLELFLAHLFISSLPEHREAAFCMLDSFPPYQVDRITNHIKEKLKKNTPRSLKTCVEKYLRKREANTVTFDNAALRQRKALTSLYARFRIKPDQRAQAILFDRKPPEDSKVFKMVSIAKEKDPGKQAEMILEYKIPYPIASSIIKQMTPSTLVALISVMSSQELLSSMGSLKKHGAFKNKEVTALVKEKLKKAGKQKTRVDVLKGKKAAETAGVSEELKQELQDVTEKQIKKVTIKRSTALFIDKSGSMNTAIELGKQLGALISAGITADFYCYAFDVMPYELDIKTDKLADWERALRHIRAGGGTSLGSCIRLMAQNGQKVEQFVFITDQDENNPPYFQNAYIEYADRMGVSPDVVIIHIENRLWHTANELETACKKLKVSCDKITIKDGTDYYSLPNILTLLSRKSRYDLLMEIMAVPLPKRSFEVDRKKATQKSLA